jgi:hypothetical protein
VLGLLDVGGLALSPFVVQRFNPFNLGMAVQILILILLGIRLTDVIIHGGHGENSIQFFTTMLIIVINGFGFSALYAIFGTIIPIKYQ